MLLCEWHIDVPFGRQAEVVAMRARVASLARAAHR
jgi:hypothetical protein